MTGIHSCLLLYLHEPSGFNHNLKTVAKYSTQSGWTPNPGLLCPLDTSAARVSSAVWCFAKETEEGRGGWEERRKRKREKSREVEEKPENTFKNKLSAINLF